MVPVLLPVMLMIFPQLLYLYSTTVSPASSISAMTSFCNSKFFVTVPSDSFSISHVHAILNLSLSARFSHGADLFFSRKGFIYEAYQKYRSAPCGGDPLHYAVPLLRSVRAAMAVTYSHPHTSDSWR